MTPVNKDFVQKNLAFEFPHQRFKSFRAKFKGNSFLYRTVTVQIHDISVPLKLISERLLFFWGGKCDFTIVTFMRCSVFSASYSMKGQIEKHSDAGLASSVS